MAPKLSDEMAVVFRQENLKRAGGAAHQRYELYKAAKTVGEAVRLGAARADVTNDVKLGYCHVVGAALAPANGRAGAEAAPPERKQQRPGAAEGQQASRPAGASPSPSAPSSSSAPAAASAAPPAAGTGRCGGSSAAAAAAVRGGAPGPQSATSASASSADISFAKLEGKPIKFMKRVMGEAKRILSEQGKADAKSGGYSFELLDRDDLTKWRVTLTDLNADGKLAKDLAKQKLPPSIDLELTIPDGFPLEPPFARVLYPQLKSGFVFSRGGICFEPLTTKGWAPSMTLPALAIAIKGIFDFGGVELAGVGDRVARRIPGYTEEGARKDHAHIVAAHQGGASSTYGRNYKS